MTWIQWIKIAALLIRALREKNEGQFNTALSLIPKEDKVHELAACIDYNDVEWAIKQVQGWLEFIIGKDKK